VLQLLTYLQYLRFDNCRALPRLNIFLPQGLRRLDSLPKDSKNHITAQGGPSRFTASAMDRKLRSLDLWGMPKIKGNKARYKYSGPPCWRGKLNLWPSASSCLSLHIDLHASASNLHCTSIRRLVSN
jgi:hypothetical protein